VTRSLRPLPSRTKIWFVAKSTSFTQPAALQQAEAGAVEKKRHDPRHAGQLLQDRPGLLAGEDHGQVLGALGPHDIVEPRQVHPEHLSLQEEQRAECLVLG
jgi:hypothetical protein